MSQASINQATSSSGYHHRIGWWENLQETPIELMVKTHGFPVNFPNKTNPMIPCFPTWFLSNSQPQSVENFWAMARRATFSLHRCTQRPGGQPAWVSTAEGQPSKVSLWKCQLSTLVEYTLEYGTNISQSGKSEDDWNIRKLSIWGSIFPSETCSFCLVLPKISGIEWPRCTGHYLQQVIPRNPISKSAESKAIAGIIREDGFGMVWP